eukprot:c29153_g1_i3 orf=1353-2627(+)
MQTHQSPNPETSDSRNTVRTRHSSAMPIRAPPPPPQKDTGKVPLSQVPKEAGSQLPPPAKRDSDQHPSHGAVANAPLGAFWSTKYAQEVQLHDSSDPGFDKGGDNASPPMHISKSVNVHAKHVGASPPNDRTFVAQAFKKSGITQLVNKIGMPFHHPGGGAYDDPNLDGYEMVLDGEKVDCNDKGRSNEHRGDPQKVVGSGSGVHSTDEAFSAFVAEFQGSVNLSDENRNAKNQNLQMGSEKLRADLNQPLEAEKIRVELDQALKEKAELAYKYEKLTAICRSQRQEIHDLKSELLAAKKQNCGMPGQDVVSGSQTASAQSSNAQVSEQHKQSTSPYRSWQAVSKSEKQVGSIWDLQEGLPLSSYQGRQSSEAQTWKEVINATASQISPKQSAFNMKSPFQGSSGINKNVDSPKFDSPKYDCPK